MNTIELTLQLGITTVALLTAIFTLVGMVRTKKTVNEIHVLTNSRLTEVLDRVDQLTDALELSGVAVPDDPATNGV